MSAEEKNNLNLVKVYVRERPTTQSDFQAKRQNVVQEISSNEIVIKAGATTKKYNFNHVFDKKTSQEEVYNVVVAPLIDFVLSGYTCTVFAYGQTSTGKTFTIIGKDRPDFINDSSNGIIPRASVNLYAELKKHNVNFTMSVSFIEIYNEEVRDLLVKNGPPLKVYDDPDNEGATCVKGVIEKPVETVEEIFEQLRIGTAERHTAQTNLNRLSSRSHMIFTICVKTSIVTDGEEIITTGKLYMVDLAGSENIGKSGATKMRAREAGSINKSLLALGKVIKALALKMPYVPYRESNLTRILQDCLGGKSKSSMIATFSLSIDVLDETLSTLEYAQVARNIANCPTVNINRKPKSLNEYEQEVSNLRQKLNDEMAGDGFYMPESTYAKMKFDIENKHERILILNQEIERMEKDLAQQRKLYDDSVILCKNSHSELEELKRKFDEAKDKFREDLILRCLKQAEIDALLQSEKELREICDTVTKHGDIYYKKYELQCKSTLDNANTAKSIYSLSGTFLNKLKTSSDRFYSLQTTRMEDLRPVVDEIKEIRINNAAEFDQLQSKMSFKSEFWNLNFDMFKETPYNDLEAHATALLENSLQARLKSAVETKEVVDNVKEVVVNTISEVAAETVDCGRLIDIEIAQGNKIEANLCQHRRKLCESLQNRKRLNEKQLLANRKMQDLQIQLIKEMMADAEDTERELELIRRVQENIELDNSISENALNACSSIHEILKIWAVELERSSELLPVIDEARNSIKNSTRICEEELDAYQNQSLEYLKGLNDAFEAKVSQTDEDFKNSVGNWGRQLDVIKGNLKGMEEKHLKNIDSQLDWILSNMKTFEDDMNQSNKMSMQYFEIFLKEVTHQVHAGDTPVKAERNLPRDNSNQ